MRAIVGTLHATKMNLIPNPLLATALLLAVSNLFMAFAWHGHLKNLATSPWYVAGPCLMGAVYFIFRA